MHHFYDAHSVTNAQATIAAALAAKSQPVEQVGKGKTMVLLFFNSSLRTRLSTEIAAQQLGMNVVTMDMAQSWNWELEEGATMDQNTAEHVKDAARVICSYADIIGIRSFPTLKNRDEDYSDPLLKTFMQYATKPVVNLESAVLHPLQSLADFMTIAEQPLAGKKPKIVLSWAPHVKALPQCVSNSFLQWAAAAGHEVVMAHPEGYELAPEFAKGHVVEHDQDKALEGADFVYVKNWSSYQQYGQVISTDRDWTINADKMALTNGGKFMHCMPIRRNLIATDGVLDGPHNIMFQQAENRLFAARYVLQQILRKQ